ncbi:helix-turn-helix transcriptional regulator [Pelagibaca abyssi]|nr:helix-turn-helix transcriptional regulator [Salipiger abyssi]
MSQSALAERLDAVVSKKVDRSTINKMTLGKRAISAEELLRIAEITGFDVPGDTPSTPTIAIAGKVGAGAQVPVFDAYAKGAGPQVECPPGLSPRGVVAVEVKGDSMEPVYSAGDLLFYTRDSHEGVPSEALGRRCVCEDETGMGWVKVLREGREDGTFDLHSFNDTSPTMYGVRLKWASPVRLHWPAELARKI